MVEFRVQHKELLGFENTNFAIDIVKLTKAAKNRSYPNLSNCCHAPLKQLKKCSTCGEMVEDPRACTHKQFKLGKETVEVSAAHLDEIKKQLDDDKIIISEFRDRAEIPDLYFTDVLFSAKQHKKYKKEYLEYAEILSQTNKMAVGMMNYRSRPYPVMIYSHQDHLVIRALHFHEEVDQMPMVDKQIQVNPTKVKLLGEALKYNVNKNPFDIGKFTNIRAQQEEQLIEKCLKGEELPKVEKVEIKSTQDNDEIVRLQELLKKQRVEATPTPTAPTK